MSETFEKTQLKNPDLGFGMELLKKSSEEMIKLGIKRCYFKNDNPSFWKHMREKYKNKIGGIWFVEMKN